MKGLVSVADLREHPPGEPYPLAAGAIVTPAARAFADAHGIELRVASTRRAPSRLDSQAPTSSAKSCACGGPCGTAGGCACGGGAVAVSPASSVLRRSDLSVFGSGRPVRPSRPEVRRPLDLSVFREGGPTVATTPSGERLTVALAAGSGAPGLAALLSRIESAGGTPAEVSASLDGGLAAVVLVDATDPERFRTELGRALSSDGVTFRISGRGSA